MSIQRVQNKIEIQKEPGAIFASAITTDYVELTNFNYVDFLVYSGVGTAANTTITIKGKLGAYGTAATIPFTKKTTNGYEDVANTGDTLNVGGTAGSCGKAIYRIDADKLAEYGYDRVALCTTAITSSTVPGAIITCVYEPRYSE